MNSISIGNFLSSNLDEFFVSIFDAFEISTGVKIQLSTGKELSVEGLQELDGAFLCGLAYAGIAEKKQLDLLPLCAPQMHGDSEPLYSCEILVAREHPAESLEELRGATLVVNEAQSFSGQIALAMATEGLGGLENFFSPVLTSGAHTASLAVLQDRKADVASIDRLVWEIERKQHPELATSLRTVASLGPHPMPPLVSIGGRNLRSLQDFLCQCHSNKELKPVFDKVCLERFSEVTKERYDYFSEVAKRFQISKYF